MPTDPIELPRPSQRVLIALGKQRYALDVKITPLPETAAEVVEMPPVSPEKSTTWLP